jgi:hypothetical protein
MDVVGGKHTLAEMIRRVPKRCDEAAIAGNRSPEHPRSDIRPQFIVPCIQDWLMAQEIKTLYIRPRQPLGE